VERLRAAARQARAAELPWQEKMIESGRKWMDRFHRGFTIGLIGFSCESTHNLASTNSSL
jgi:hypothetical protein